MVDCLALALRLLRPLAEPRSRLDKPDPWCLDGAHHDRPARVRLSDDADRRFARQGLPPVRRRLLSSVRFGV